MLGRTSRRLLWFWLYLLFLTSLEVFHFIAFRRHSPPLINWSVFVVWLIDDSRLAWFPSGTIVRYPHHREFLTSRDEGLNLRRTCAQAKSECYGFVWAVFIHGRFLPFTPSFATQMQAGAPLQGSSSVPALTELSPPTDAWTWTIDVWITRPLIYQLHQWATSIELKLSYWICFACSKSYEKTIKTLWTRLDVLLKTASVNIFSQALYKIINV